MKRVRLLIMLISGLTACTNQHPEVITKNTIAFGSCLRQWQPQPVWQGIAAIHPKAFVFLGDNVYTDNGPYAKHQEPERIFTAYRDLSANPEYRSFIKTAEQENIDILATWDDHDYGINDGGKDYPHKLTAKTAFMDFFSVRNLPAGGADRPGIYHSRILDIDGLKIQLLLLDTRSFRSPLQKSTDRAACPPTGTVPNREPSATILGEQQWQWLANELKETADIRLIASSIQVLPTEHCFEKWANFPKERQRLLDLIRTTNANGVVFISGDRHLAEISRLPASHAGYPLYEITASGLNSAMGTRFGTAKEANRFRTHERAVRTDNFGTIEVANTASQQNVYLQIRNIAGRLLQEYPVVLDTLRHPPPKHSP